MVRHRHALRTQSAQQCTRPNTSDSPHNTVPTPPQRLPVGYTPVSGPHTNQYDDLGHMDVRCDECGALHWIGERIAGSTSLTYQFTSCCRQGDIHLDRFRDPPDFLQDLLMAENPRARDFRKDIVSRNQASLQ